MKVFFQIAYFLVGIVQFFACWDGAKLLVGGFLGFILAALTTYIPLVGSGLGVYGATQAWDWSLTKALILFFWYVPVVIVFYGVALGADVVSKRQR